MARARKPGILMVTPEVEPFSKVGGLGVVMGSLPKVLHENKWDVRLITPLYGNIDRREFNIRRVTGLGKYSFNVGEKTYEVRFFRSNIPGRKVQVFFVECDQAFGRKGIYTFPETGESFPDNSERFILFSKAVLLFLKLGVFEPDIIHLNDHTTTYLAAYLRTQETDPRLRNIPLVYTIHNLAYQGYSDIDTISLAGLDWKYAYMGGPFEFYGKYNPMKVGIVFSDYITTVSPTYARETLNSDLGYGLQGLLAEKGERYVGINNGIDYEVWDSEKDPLLKHHFSRSNLQGKLLNKRDLLAQSGFDVSKLDWPLIGMVGRLVEQKGLDILVKILDNLLSQDVFFICFGNGHKYYYDMLMDAQNRHPDKLRIYRVQDEQLIHLIQAACDIFLMPSRFEPAGVGQLHAIRYGAVPLVRRTGGLADTIKDYDPPASDGWGFTFDEYTPEALKAKLDRTLEVYKDKKIWRNLVRRAMSVDCSWNVSVKEYENIYRYLLNKQ